MEDRELFELCKEVYKRTGWSETARVYESFTDSKGNEQCNILIADSPYLAPHQYQTPLYTSDYLLEKLPSFYNEKLDTLQEVTLQKINKLWYADIRAKDLVTAETPLKAVLKLTIALHKAGEMK